MTHRSLTRTVAQCFYASDELVDALILRCNSADVPWWDDLEEAVQPKDGQTQLLRFSSNDIPEKDRVECFREVFARTILNIDMEPLHGVPIDVEMTLHGLEGFGLAMGRLSPMRNRHLTSHAADDDVVLVLLLDGQGTIDQCGRQSDVVSGMRSSRQMARTGGSPATRQRESSISD